MSDKIKENIKSVSEEIATKAEHYASVSSGYQQLVQQVIQIGGKAMMSRQFSLEQANQVASMMVAAIALAKE